MYSLNYKEVIFLFYKFKKYKFKKYKLKIYKFIFKCINSFKKIKII